MEQNTISICTCDEENEHTANTSLAQNYRTHSNLRAIKHLIVDKTISLRNEHLFWQDPCWEYRGQVQDFFLSISSSSQEICRLPWEGTLTKALPTRQGTAAAFCRYGHHFYIQISGVSSSHLLAPSIFYHLSLARPSANTFIAPLRQQILPSRTGRRAGSETHPDWFSAMKKVLIASINLFLLPWMQELQDGDETAAS